MTNQENKVHVFTNGIFNDEDGAAKYAVQNRRDENAALGEEPDLDKNPIYFVYFPKTNNALSEMMVAGYQKYLEGDTLGLTNASQNVKGLVEEYGATGMQLDGHSRGTLTITNVYTSLLNADKAGAYPRLSTNMVGPAANVHNADNKLAELQGRDEILVIDPLNSELSTYRPTTEQEKSEMSIHYQTHKSDLVGTIIGLNPSTGGNNSKGKTMFGEWKDMFGNPATVHSCYGVGNIDCKDKNYWDNGSSSNEIGLPIWKPVYDPNADYKDEK